MHGRTWKHLPIKFNIINTVHNLSSKEHIPDMPDNPLFEWQPHISLFPPIVNDDVDNDDARIFESVASNNDAITPLIYADDDASFHS